MLLGAHMPTTGGLVNGILRGQAIGCDVVQIFTKSPQQWASKELSAEECEAFRAAAKEYLIGPVVAHDSYLINLASVNPEILEKSRNAFLHEVHRADSLGIAYLVTHMGSYKDSTVEEGLERLCESLQWVLERSEGVGTTICLETTAGQGSSLGHDFEHFPFIFERCPLSTKLALCFDTCHAFAAGYDLSTPEACAETLERFDSVVGLERVRVFHLNGAKKERGSRVD
ncbi:MAG TPA: deoxyribonuclease IV, partial [Armatimonadota bacterium]